MWNTHDPRQKVDYGSCKETITQEPNTSSTVITTESNNGYFLQIADNLGTCYLVLIELNVLCNQSFVYRLVLQITIG